MGGDGADEFGAAVDDAVVDDSGVDGFPEKGAQCAAAFSEDVVVNRIEVVFVFKQYVHGAEGGGDFGGQARGFDVQDPGAYHACNGEIQHGRVQAVRHHRQCAVEFFFHQVHSGVGFVVDENHAFEEVAVEHGFDGDVADDDGRNGEQYQRQGDDPRAFVRVVVFAQAVMVAV